MPGHELLQRAAIELATGSVQLRGQAFGLFEHGIGDGNGRLHTLSITMASGAVEGALGCGDWYYRTIGYGQRYGVALRRMVVQKPGRTISVTNEALSIHRAGASG